MPSLDLKKFLFPSRGRDYDERENSMYYPDEIIEEVRMRNDIVDVISAYVKLQKKGASYFGLCPFHNEKSPSFSVSSSKQMYYCFGCGAGGNVITFLMEYENYSFPEAVQYLAERAGVELPKEEFSKEARQQADLKSTLLDIHKVAAKYYYYQLKSETGKRGYAYLKSRGLSDETILHFGLGFSNPYSDDLYRYLKNQGYQDAVIKESGLVKIEEKGSFDKFWNRVMFPIMDINNRVIGFGGRVMGDGSPKYLNSPETKIFDKSRNLYGLNIARRSRKSYILVCEGYMDVISMHQAGFTNAVASLGTAFTVQHGILLKRYTDEVVLTYDSDDAGKRAALRAIPILKESGLSIRVLNMKPYKDPDEFIKNEGAEAFEQRINQATNSFLFEIDYLKSSFDMNDPEDKTKFYNETAKKLIEFRDELERNNYIEAVSKTYGIEYDALRKKVNKLGSLHSYVGETTRPKSGIQSKKDRDDGIKQAQRLLLTWLSEEPRIFEQVSRYIEPTDFTEPLYAKVASLLFGQAQSGSINPGAVLNHFINDEEEYKIVAEVFNTKLSGLSPEERNRAFRETILRIKKNSLDYASRNVKDINELQAIIKAQAALKDLNISLE